MQDSFFLFISSWESIFLIVDTSPSLHFFFILYWEAILVLKNFIFHVIDLLGGGEILIETVVRRIIPFHLWFYLPKERRIELFY